MIVLISCRDNVIDEDSTTYFSDVIVYTNGDQRDFINSSYSQKGHNDTYRFVLALDESYGDFALLSRVGCVIYNPNSFLTLNPVGYDNYNYATPKVAFIQLVEQDLPGPEYVYDYGDSDFLRLESVDTIAHTFSAKGKLTFMRVGFNPFNNYEQRLVIEFAVNDAYEAK